MIRSVPYPHTLPPQPLAPSGGSDAEHHVELLTQLSTLDRLQFETAQARPHPASRFPPTCGRPAPSFSHTQACALQAYISLCKALPPATTIIVEAPARASLAELSPSCPAFQAQETGAPGCLALGPSAGALTYTCALPLQATSQVFA